MCKKAGNQKQKCLWIHQVKASWIYEKIIFMDD